MTFIWPLMLFSLLVLPLLIALYWRQQQRRRAVAARYGTMGFVQQSAGKPLAWRRHVPPVLFLVGLTILLIAMARPEATVSLPVLRGTVVLAFDVSGSMAADDLKPSRMEAAKTAAINFVQRQPSTVQIGVVAFSDSGLIVQPPTNDQEAVLSTIQRLGPERGTSLGQGIFAALNLIFMPKDEVPNIYSNLTPTAVPSPAPVPAGVYAPSAIVLLTDGENTAPPEPMEAAQAAAERGVRIYSIGVGSPAGMVLEVEGFRVLTRLDEPMLQQISQFTGGEYFNAENEEELRAVYENLSPELILSSEKMEITALLVGASVLLLLLGGIYSMAWMSRLP